MIDQKYDNKLLIEYVGRRIATFRKKQNLSQAELANKIGISGRQLSKYEIGRNRITIDRLIFISQILDIEIISFLPSLIDNKKNDLKLSDDFTKFKNLLAEDLLLKITQLVDQKLAIK